MKTRSSRVEETTRKIEFHSISRAAPRALRAASLLMQNYRRCGRAHLQPPFPALYLNQTSPALFTLCPALMIVAQAAFLWLPAHDAQIQLLNARRLAISVNGWRPLRFA